MKIAQALLQPWPIILILAVALVLCVRNLKTLDESTDLDGYARNLPGVHAEADAYARNIAGETP